MANGTPFERALEVSTPGFDSLLQTIQQETQRFQRNMALARQRKQKLDLFKAKQEIQQENQAEMIRLKDSVQRARMQAQKDIEEDLIEKRTEEEIETWQKTTAKANQLEAAQEALEEWNTAQTKAEEKQSTLMGEYESVFGHVLPFPNVEAHRTETGIKYFNKRQNGELEEINALRERAKTYKALGDFIQTINNPNNLARKEDGKYVTPDGNHLVTLENQDEWLKKLRGSTMEQKNQYLTQILTGELVPYTPEYKNQITSGREGTEDEEYSDLGFDTVENQFRSTFINLHDNFRNEQLPLNPEVLNKAGITAPAETANGSPYTDLGRTTYGKMTELRKAYRSYMLNDTDWFQISDKGEFGPKVKPTELSKRAKDMWKTYKIFNNAKNAMDAFSYTDFDVPVDASKESWVFNFDQYSEVVNNENFSKAITTPANVDEDTESVKQIVPNVPLPSSKFKTTLDSLRQN